MKADGKDKSIITECIQVQADISIFIIFIRILIIIKICFLLRLTDTVTHMATDPSVVKQQVLERSTGILLIRELPDTVRNEGNRGRGL